jgi:diguanylate cyclase (GGDEF)-like protein/PAS domain S-box-containing protein
MKNKIKIISGNRKPAKDAKKKTPPLKKSLLPRQKKTQKIKTVLKDSAGKPAGFRGIVHDMTKRKRAEEMARKKYAWLKKQAAMSPEETQRMLQELQVHKIELEMQNEELLFAQEQLDAARARYFDLYDLAPVGYCTISEQGLILEANLTAATLLSVTRGKLVKQSLTRFILKEDQNIYYMHHKQILNTGKPQTCELRMVKKDSTLFWAHLAATAARDEGGATICRVVMSDITERKQAESQREAALELLKQSEAQYRLLADHIKDQVWLMDLDLKWIYVSPSVEKLLGYTLEELKQLPLDKLLTATSYSAAMDVFSMEMPKALAKTLPSSFKVLRELECRCKDDRTLWIESTLSFIQDEDGKPLSILGEGRDITERKQIEEVLRQSEEKYRNILENIQEGYFEVDLAGNFTFLNDSICLIHGYPKKELMGMNNRQYTEKEVAKKVFQAFNRVYKTGKPLKEIGWQIIRKDGAKRDIEASVSLLKDSSGKPTGFRGIIRDITERIQMEEKLHLEEQRFRALAEQSSDIIVLVNREGTITYENPAVEKILGFKAEEKIGTRIFDDLHPDDFKLVADSLYTLLSDTNTPTKRSELRLCHVDGNWHTFDVVGSNLVQDNVVETILVNLHDITERKRAEDALRQEQLFSKSVLDNLPGIFYLYTYPENRLVLWNKQHETLLGYNAEEMKDRLVTEWFAPENRNAVLKAIEEVMEKGQNSIESFLVAKDGRQIPCILRGVRFEVDDQSYFMGIGTDITERKKAEEALRKSEQKYLELSIIDGLTQLYNSRHFYDQLKKETERSNRHEQPLTLLLLDLDKFKDFNDTYGHVEGDYVLSRLSQLIKRCLRETDSAYRYGGEEFTILLPMTTSEEGLVTAKRIQMELKKEDFSPVSAQKVYMTVSIGLAQHKPKEDVKMFIQRVDRLMYKGKKSGRDRICSDDGSVL